MFNTRVNLGCVKRAPVSEPLGRLGPLQEHPVI